jgi:hypothetical protein
MSDFIQALTGNDSSPMLVTGTNIKPGKRALDVNLHGPLDTPVLTDFIMGYNSGSNFIVQYKQGGESGTVLKTLTFDKNGCAFKMAIS